MYQVHMHLLSPRIFPYVVLGHNVIRIYYTDAEEIINTRIFWVGWEIHIFLCISILSLYFKSLISYYIKKPIKILIFIYVLCIVIIIYNTMMTICNNQTI